MLLWFGEEDDHGVFWERWCFGHGVPAGFLRLGRREEWVCEQDQAHPNPCAKLGVSAALGNPRAMSQG